MGGRDGRLGRWRNEKIVREPHIYALLSHEQKNSSAGARGNAQAVGILKTVADQFSDLSIQMLDVFADNEMAATSVLYQGIHSGTCMGITATGKKISFEALENFKVVDGKIVESWGYWPDKEMEETLRS